MNKRIFFLFAIVSAFEILVESTCHAPTTVAPGIDSCVQYFHAQYDTVNSNAQLISSNVVPTKRLGITLSLSLSLSLSHIISFYT